LSSDQFPAPIPPRANTAAASTRLYP
jgi:hypothetical protein